MNNQNNALNQAKAQYDSIAAMVAALNVDYDRLEELREKKQDYIDNGLAVIYSQASPDDAEELATLKSAAGDCKDFDSARERIQQDALDVQVRSDWYSPGSNDDSRPSEFAILLCTGGPAVRIMGELDEYLQPCRAWIEYQDWGTPWTMLDSMYVDQSTLSEYCQQFYFGE